MKGREGTHGGQAWSSALLCSRGLCGEGHKVPPSRFFISEIGGVRAKRRKRLVLTVSPQGDN